MAKRRRTRKRTKIRKWEYAATGGVVISGVLLATSGLAVVPGSLGIVAVVGTAAYALFNWSDGDDGIMGSLIVLAAIATMVYVFGGLAGMWAW